MNPKIIWQGDIRSDRYRVVMCSDIEDSHVLVVEREQKDAMGACAWVGVPSSSAPFYVHVLETALAAFANLAMEPKA